MEIITLEEAAKMLKMSEYTLRRYAKRRAVPAHKIGGQWRFSREELLEWFRAAAPGSKNSLVHIPLNSATDSVSFRARIPIENER